MTGSYAKILRHCADFLPEFKISAICPNWQSHEETKKEQRFSDVDYLYTEFNSLFERIDISEFCETYSSINIYEVLLVDKTHFKKMTGDYQLRYICTAGERLAEIYKRTQPSYIFFPIIETVDAMMAYRMALHFGIRPIMYCHSRFTNLSFFSESHLELLPAYLNDVEKPESDKAWGVDFLDEYRAKPGPFNYRPAFSGGDVYADFGEDSTAIQRLFRSVWLKYTIERHNRMISLWISFQVHFQKIFQPIRNFIFHLIERFYIKPLPAPKVDYDFFPLHFSPESSINVPAPYFIDQTRVVDKILLDGNHNRILVVKEHPAMFGVRGYNFYRSLKNRPFVSFVHRLTPSHQLIRNACTVYSVTGTACLEAFFLEVKWVQFGSNYLSNWLYRRESSGVNSTPLDFICDVRSISCDFVLYSPGRSLPDDRILFSKKNVEKLCEHLKFHIRHDEKFRLVSINA